jgi:2,4-dienoyl-CoA reductase-like NADH-dependent reductase (Old Yellow Enzyme family)
LMLEVLDAVISVWGADRVGLRISPLNSYNSMIDSDPVAVTTYIAQQCSARGSPTCMSCAADFFQAQQGDVMTPAREHFKGVLIGNMGYTADEAEQGHRRRPARRRRLRHQLPRQSRSARPHRRQGGTQCAECRAVLLARTRRLHRLSRAQRRLR